MFNVNRKINDAFYRYKMPKIQTKVEGNGNGIKTVIVNLPEVSTALYRNGSYLVKYFGNELGTQTIIDEKSPKYVINGSHDANKLQDILDGFIRKFVLCTNCENPETVLTVKKKTGLVATKCKACGHTDSLDPRHKITNFIIKNPPKSEDKVTKNESDERRQGDEAEDEADNIDSDVWDEDDDASDNVSPNNESDATSKSKNSTNVSQKSALINMDITNNDSKKSKELKNGPVIEKTHSERIGEFYQLVKEFYENDEINLKIQNILESAERLSLQSGWVKVLIEICLSDPSRILEDIKKYRNAFVIITRKKGDENEQRKTQRYFIAGIELTIQKFEKDLLPITCRIMNELYDTDILEEDSILDWHVAGPAKAYKKDPQMQKLIQNLMEKCNPLIEWLKNAEEDDSDVEGSETEKLKEEPIKEVFVAQKIQKSANRKSERYSDEEVDIDEI